MWGHFKQSRQCLDSQPRQAIGATISQCLNRCHKAIGLVVGNQAIGKGVEFLAVVIGTKGGVNEPYTE